MNYYKRSCGLIFFLIACYVNTRAQELTIGDTLPDCSFSSVLRYPSPSVRLSDFRGKLLILALWRTTCGHSISVFSHLDSIQQEFGEKVVVLGISSDQREVIEHYFRTNIVAKQTRLPTVSDDTVLSGKRFSFVYIPHMVVVDGAGVIRAITYPESITSVSVQAWLAGGVAKVPLKKQLSNFGFDVPVYEEGNGRNINQIVYSSVISRYLPGVLHIEELASSDTRYFYKAYNKTIPELYAQALDFPPDARRFVLEVKDSSRFIKKATDDEEQWNGTHRWVYNLILPKEYPNPNQFALEDLNRFFGVRATVEKRKMKCLLLVRKGKEERWRTKGDKGALNKNGNVIYIQNIPIHDVVNMWDDLSPLPIFNNTGLANEKADMVISSTPADLNAFRKQIQPYDLDLIPSEREIDVMVIKEP